MTMESTRPPGSYPEGVDEHAPDDGFFVGRGTQRSS